MKRKRNESVGTRLNGVKLVDSFASPLTRVACTKPHTRSEVLVERKEDREKKQQQKQKSVCLSPRFSMEAKFGRMLLPLIWASCLVTFLIMVPVVESIWLDLPSSGTKCVSEEIQSRVVVLADYHVIDDSSPGHLPTVSARVCNLAVEIDGIDFDLLRFVLDCKEIG